MSSPFMPSPISYNDIPAGGETAVIIVSPRDPSNFQDVSQPSGTLWLSDSTRGGSGNLFVQSGFEKGFPNWLTQLSASNVGESLLTGVSIDADAVQSFNVSNPIITSSSKIIASIQGATTGASLSVQSITPSEGEFNIVIQNGTGATTSTANITVTYLVS